MLKTIYWWFIHRFHPSHRYNVIKIKTLSPGYYDPDVRMLHACFDLFAEWFRYNTIENEHMTKKSLEETNPGVWDEMVELYKWWSVYHVDPDWSMGGAEKEDEMMMRLMKIRRCIWYF